MTPDQLAKSGTEHAIQRAFFAWCNEAAKYGMDAANDWAAGRATPADMIAPQPELYYIHAIPNGGQRGDGTAKGRMIAGAKMKAEGVRAGVPDTFLPVPMKCYAGLYIEFKRPEFRNRARGGMSEEQQKWYDYLRAVGYAVIVCYSWREAADVVRAYLRMEI